MPIDVKSTLTSSFSDEWATFPVVPFVNISSHLFEVQNQFNISAIQSFVDQDIQNSSNVEFSERYHERNLKFLAQTFADILYNIAITSNATGVYTIDAQAIASAKDVLKSTGPCEIYPC